MNQVIPPSLVEHLWQSGRPTDPGVPPSTDPVALSDSECIRRWVQRELRGRYKQYKQEVAEKAALAALDTSAADSIE